MHSIRHSRNAHAYLVNSSPFKRHLVACSILLRRNVSSVLSSITILPTLSVHSTSNVTRANLFRSHLQKDAIILLMTGASGLLGEKEF
jgi:hypothetical protein